VSAILRYALARFKARRRRVLLTAAGITAASALVGAAVTVAWGLSTGFDRAASLSGLPDAIASFDARPLADVAARAQALPYVRAVAYRLTVSGRHVRFGDHASEHATLVGVRPGARGYALLRGRAAAHADEAVVEAGLARSWHVEPGATIVIDGRVFSVVGVGLSPDTVAFPLAKGPRLWLSYEDVRELAGAPEGAVDEALLWLRDPRELEVVLAQARVASYGVTGLQFRTRAGVRALVDQAGGIVLALLVGFSLVATAAAGAMLTAAAAADVRRRLPSIGVLRAVGVSPRAVTLGFAVEAAAIALPAATAGLFVGWLAVSRPSARLLQSLNELPPGTEVIALMALALIAIVVLVAGASAWPAWRAAVRSPVETLRGADVVGTPRRATLPPGPAGLGARLALTRPFRTGATVAVLSASAAVILLILTIATLVARLQSSPAAVGKRYQLTVDAPAEAAAAIARTSGISAATPRWSVDAADSFSLGEPFTIVAFGANHGQWEAPALAEGRRVRGDAEAEVGLGLAQALDLHPGAILAAQVPGSRELRFRVVGIDRVLQEDGRVVYVRPRRLLSAVDWVEPTVAVKLWSGANAEAVEASLERRGFFATSSGGVSGEAVQGWASRNHGFVAVLVALLRAVAVLIGLVCLYVLAQTLALTAQERRGAVAIVRACGGSRAQVGAVFAGAGVTITAVALPLATVLERELIGPAVSRLAASYASLPLTAGPLPIGIVGATMVVGSLLVAAWVARTAVAEPVATGLRRE
jgi:ABC-type lipoprotein release transport system permease subunit